MKSNSPRLLTLLFISLLPLFSTHLNAVDMEQRKDLQGAFLSFYLSVGPARSAADPAEVVKAGSSAWHLPDDKARRSLNRFGVWLLAAKPTDFSIEKVATAGDLARMTILFARVKEPHPSRAELTLMRPGLAADRGWKIVNFDLLESTPSAPVSPDISLPAPDGENARETLEGYLKMLSQLAADPATQVSNPQKLADELAAWWTDKPERSQTRAMTQGAMFFRLYQPKEWTLIPAVSTSATEAIFSVRVQPGNEVARRLGPRTMVFGLTHGEASGWKISTYTNPQLAPEKGRR